jgi:60 kDa SS-A/Ro ribonucleoprotein
MSYDKLIGSTQREPVLGRNMVENNAGGYGFQVDKWQRLRRFLILGSDGGSYYATPKQLTRENADNLIDCINENGTRVVLDAVYVSERGDAVKNDSAIFALAAATVFGDLPTRRSAFSFLATVCRIGTHLFQFVAYRKALGGGWGRTARVSVGRWYNDKSDDKLIFQTLKYQQRDGWSHRDVLRLAHPKPIDERHKMIYWAITRKDWERVAIRSTFVEAWRALHNLDMSSHAAANIIKAHRIPRELVPTEMLAYSDVWAALLEDMPMMALVRNLGNMSKVGTLKPFSDGERIVVEMLTDETEIAKSRIHPMAILLALKTYASGAGFKGGNSWDVNQNVVEALNKAFHAAFKNVKSTGKRILIGVDVSGSMSWNHVPNSNITAAEAAAAVAMTIKRSESNTHVMGFSTSFIDLGVSASDSLDTVMKKTAAKNFGGTDTSVAINYAISKNLLVDAFVILTDNEAWAGKGHTFQAMERYRKLSGLPAKLAVCAFTPAHHSIADQNDFLSMDFVGLDASLPQALQSFIAE